MGRERLWDGVKNVGESGKEAAERRAARKKGERMDGMNRVVGMNGEDRDECLEVVG